MVWALYQCFLFRVRCSLATDDILSFFSTLSKIIQGDNRVRTRDLSDCNRMLYHWAIRLSHGFNKITANVCRWRQLSIMFVLRSQTSFCDCASHLYQCVQNYIRGHPDSNQGALRLQLNALPLSYIPSAYRFNNITANAPRSVERWNKVCCSKSSDVAWLISHFLHFQNLYGGIPGSNQSLLELQPNGLPLSYIPSTYGFNSITANVCSSGTIFVMRSQMFFWDCASQFCKFVQNDSRGHPGWNQGPL